MVESRFNILIRVGVIAVIWFFWMRRNVKTFNTKNSSNGVRLCSIHMIVVSTFEDHDRFTEVCIGLEDMAKEFITQHRWQYNRKIDASLV
jgi:hypothetical protein